VRRAPIVESTTRYNPYLPYAQDKIAAEEVVQRAYDRHGFPATIVRPSHTYDDASPPLPGGWTAWDRIARGDELVVPGDGTNLWTVTHASDFAIGLVGLIGNYSAIGEDFHITSNEALPWNEILAMVALTTNQPSRLLHLPTELILEVAGDWIWAQLFAGDLGHTALFDNTKIKRFVPSFAPVVTWPEGVRRLAAWRAAHPDLAGPDPETEAILQRLVRARQIAGTAVAEFARTEP
jgi:nucleoside-diphosphate-sugar epimerase